MFVPKLPQKLWLVRHGETEANVAMKCANQKCKPTIGIDKRDADMLLTALGRKQARVVGEMFAALPPQEKPTIIFTSPYKRARKTAYLIFETARLGALPQVDGAQQYVKVVIDERLREQDFGIFSGYAATAFRECQPLDAKRLEQQGFFFWRPPGGENWCDVILRLRSFMKDLEQYCKKSERVLIVCHRNVMLCLRYIIENLNESQLMNLHKTGISNCQVISYPA